MVLTLKKKHATKKTIKRIQSSLDRLNLTTDKKMAKKYNNFGGLMSYRQVRK